VLFPAGCGAKIVSKLGELTDQHLEGGHVRKVLLRFCLAHCALQLALNIPVHLLPHHRLKFINPQTAIRIAQLAMPR
jgi:hypothetical protein